MRLLETFLLGDRSGDEVSGHEHVVVGGVVVAGCLGVVAGRVVVELTLELEHVAEQVVLHCRFRQPRCACEKVAERDGVLLQVCDGLVLAGLVLLRGCDGVVDEELDVVAPHELAVQERLAGFGAVDGCDRLGERDRVVVERFRSGREGFRPRDAGVGGVHREHGVLAEQVVERDRAGRPP